MLLLLVLVILRGDARGESLSVLGRLGSSWLPLCAKVSGSLSTQWRRRAG